jgi:hypothetical protein
MVLLLVQKACTAFHEFEPAWHAGALDPGQLDYFRGRLAARIGVVLAVARANGLDGLNGIEGLAHIRERVLAAPTMGALGALAEEMHAASHAIGDALEGVTGACLDTTEAGGSA